MDEINLPPETTLNLDQPRVTDFEYEAVFGSTKPTEVQEFFPVHIQNQGAKSITRMACSRYGICHAINAQNEYVKGKDGMRYYEIQAEGMWENYLKVNPLAESQGATLQSALDQFKNIGYITGYTRLNSIEDMKSSINNVRPIYTGSQNGDWAFSRDTKSYRVRTDGRVVGHVFCIIGYNQSSWIAINSYGPSMGVFYIPFELTNTLFSRYSISDDRDSEILAKFINK